MNETELERIVVRLVGDGSSYDKMIKSAIQVTEQSTKAIEASLSHLATSGTSLMRSLALFGVVGSLKDAFEQFSKLQRGQIGLRTAIESNGAVVETTMASYEKFAKTITETTLITKGEIMTMARRVELMGITGDAAESVIRRSIGLAEATDRDAQSMLMIVSAMDKGNVAMLRRLPGLRGIKDEVELTTKANKMMEAGLKQAEAVANTTSGRLERLGRSLKFLGTEMGAIVSDVLDPFVQKLLDLTNQFKAMDPDIKRAVVGMLALVTGAVGFKVIFGYVSPILVLFKTMGAPILAVSAAVFVVSRQFGGFKTILESVGIRSNEISRRMGTTWNAVKDSISDAFLYAEFAAKNFDTAWELAATSAAYSATKLFNQIIYFFTDVVPATLTWFANNWSTIFTDVFNFTGTVFSNLGDNFYNLVNEMIDYLSSGGTSGWNFAWKGLTEGFEATTTALVIPERVVGPIEKELERELNALAEKFGQSFADFKANRLKDLGKARDPFGAIADHASKAEKEIHKVDAAILGSAEAFSRITDYVDNLMDRRKDNGHAEGANALDDIGEVAGGVVGIARNMPAAPVGGDQGLTAVLARLTDAIVDMNSRPEINFVPTELA